MVFKDRQKVTAIVVSLFLAFIMWIYVMSDKNPIQQNAIEDIPVELVNTDYIEQSGLALVPNQKFSVSVTIKGRIMDIINVSASDFKIVADFNGYTLKKGDNNIPVEVRERPKGTEVENKTGYPYYIKVKLDKFVEKSVSVAVSVTGSAKEGYGFIKNQVRPSEVLVSGPESAVEKVYSAAGQIDLNGSSSDVSASVPLKPIDKEGNQVPGVSIEPKFVDVEVPIKPAKVVPVVVKYTGNIAQNLILRSVKPKVETITIIGDSKYIDKIKEITTVPFDISKLTTSSTRDVRLNIPNGVGILGDTRSINVEFTVENKIEKTFTVPIKILNQSEGFNYDALSSDSITITIIGAESIVNSIDINNISAYIDVKDLGENIHTIPVKVVPPDNVEIKDYGPKTVNVTITKKQ